jgi:hypothetical protein
VRGGGSVNGRAVKAGDGVAFSEEPVVELSATLTGTEFLVFDLA